GALDIVLLDSVAAMSTSSEIEGEMGDAHVGVQARLMSQAMRKLTAAISKTNCICVFINQIREKIGVMYGNPETTPGGRALKFYASVRIDVRKGEPIKDGSEVRGNRVKCKVVKNKVAPPFKTAEFDMLFGEGISKLGEIIDCAVEFDIIKKSGSWFSYDDMKIGQGKDKVKDFLKENKEVCDEIEAKVRDVFAKNTDLIPTDSDDDDASEGAAETENTAEDTTAASEEKPKKRSKKKTEETEDDFAEFATDDIE
ncbi:MAG: DNA recombination/repair protein RecA, partial [Oscillospiraceae bacterium]|nr:DNA recombination/repair protein RecA [Oscillospiraceae bacterium]